MDDEELGAQLAQRPIHEVVRGDPGLLERIRQTFPDMRDAADAVPLAVVVPDLSSIPAAEKFPQRGAQVEAVPAPALASAPGPFERGPDQAWGPAYAALAVAVQRTQARLLADITANTAESLQRAEAAARGLVSVGRLYKRVEPRSQFTTLTVPGHEELVRFAVQDFLRAAARARSGALAASACKLIVGTSFDRLCQYGITGDFDVRKGRALDPGWAPPPEDADLYGLGHALLAGPVHALSGLRVLALLCNAERWLVAQVAMALDGPAVCGAQDVSHRGPAGPSPLRDGLVRCLTEPGYGELPGALAASCVIGMLGRCEHPGALLRAGLGAALVQGWRDASRPIAAALCAYALADLTQESLKAHYAPWDRSMSEEAVETAEPPAGVQDVDAWRARVRGSARSARLLKEEYDAGVAMMHAELAAAGLALPPPRGHAGAGAPATAADLESGPRAPSEDEALALAWAVVPDEMRAHQPAQPRDAWESYCVLGARCLQPMFTAELEADEPGLYHEW